MVVEEEPRKAPLSFRAGEFFGRNADTLLGAKGGIIGGGLGAAGGYALHPSLAGALLGGGIGAGAGYLSGRATGRFAQGVISGNAHAYPNLPAKEASAVTPATGLRRGLQLLTGSRLKALEGQAASRAATTARHHLAADRIIKGSFKSALEGAPVAAGIPADYKFVRESYRNAAGLKALERNMRAAATEHGAVQAARGTAAKALGAGALGTAIGAGLAHQHTKEADGWQTLSRPSSLDINHIPTINTVNTVHDLGDRVRKAAEPVIELTRKIAPKVSNNAKLIGGTALAGLALGAGGHALAHRRKEAQLGGGFGAALTAGMKGIGHFGGAAAKSIGAAARTGGAAAAGQAAMNAGRSGLMRAGQFIGQNPMAGAALVAAPALAAGYAAGR